MNGCDPVLSPDDDFQSLTNVMIETFHILCNHATKHLNRRLVVRSTVNSYSQFQFYQKMTSSLTTNNAYAYVHVSFLQNSIKLDGHTYDHSVNRWFNEKEGYDTLLGFLRSMSVEGKTLVHLEQSLGMERQWMISQIELFPNILII